MRRRLIVFLSLQATLAWAACGTSLTDPTEPGSGRTVNWRLEIANHSGASFGVRILLDGESIYLHSASTKEQQTIEVERPYSAGRHRVDFDILAATASPSVYAAAWTVRVTPAGPFFHADGVPTSLSVGERLTVNVTL